MVSLRREKLGLYILFGKTVLSLLSMPSLSKVSSWSFECLYAGYNSDADRFELPAYHCCKKCEWPGFSICWNKFRANPDVARIKCNSNAMRCISKCLCNTRSGGQPGPPGPQSKCQVKRKRIGRSFCLQRSCIRV